MGRGVIRAGAYLPRYVDRGRRVGAMDEDAFTFVATALERVVPREPVDTRPQRVRTLGFATPPDVGSLSALLGAPVAEDGSPGAVSTLEDAFTEAFKGSGPAWILAASRDADGPGGSRTPPPGEGGVALLVDDVPDNPAGRFDPDAMGSPAGGSVLSQLFAGAPSRLADRAAWFGDWAVDLSSGPTAPARLHGTVDRPAYTVSQGAFVPPPRYDESRASRWRFVADRCGSCGVRTFPARGRCGRCGRTDALRPEPLPLGGATVRATTWIGPGGQPTEFDLQVELGGPYGVVLAEVAPDVRVTLPVADARPEEVRIGSIVDTRLRRLYPIEGSWRYGRKAVPSVTSGGRPATGPPS
jgi:uncharacterized OB-fold protein